MTDYETAVDLAVSMARVTTREKVREVTWLPFTLLYDELVKRKEIEPVESLPAEKKWELWDLTEGSRTRRMFVVRALYVFDLLTCNNSIDNEK